MFDIFNINRKELPKICCKCALPGAKLQELYETFRSERRIKNIGVLAARVNISELILGNIFRDSYGRLSPQNLNFGLVDKLLDELRPTNPENKEKFSRIRGECYASMCCFMALQYAAWQPSHPCGRWPEVKVK